MIWNAAPLRVHFLLFVPLFGGAVALAIVARHREQRILLTQLPGIVATGLISWLEGSWLTTLRGRKIWADQAEQTLGKDARRVVQTFAEAVTELAFVRERFVRGGGSPDAAERHTELVAVILGLHRPPVPPGFAPLPPGALPIPGSPGTTSPAVTGGPSPDPWGPAIWNPIPGPP